MIVEKLKIEGIPTLLWGETSGKWIVAVHGSHSSKIDDCIWILAEEAIPCGYQVLSFDLPKHGERVYEDAPTMVEAYLQELEIIMRYARKRADQIDLFGCSMGAYFSLLAYGEEPINHVWFLSPVTDMERVIYYIMNSIGATKEQLREKKTLDNPIEPLHWDYYCYVKEHPITEWKHPTFILRGEYDDLCEYGAVAAFAEQFGCELEEQKGGEHWFHTPEELAYYRTWLRDGLRQAAGKNFSCLPVDKTYSP